MSTASKVIAWTDKQTDRHYENITSTADAGGNDMQPGQVWPFQSTLLCNSEMVTPDLSAIGLNTWLMSVIFESIYDQWFPFYLEYCLCYRIWPLTSYFGTFSTLLHLKVGLSRTSYFSFTWNIAHIRRCNRKYLEKVRVRTTVCVGGKTVKLIQLPSVVTADRVTIILLDSETKESTIIINLCMRQKVKYSESNASN